MSRGVLCLGKWRGDGDYALGRTPRPSSPKPSPFGAPGFTPFLAGVCRTPFSERSTAKLQALAWRPTGPSHQIRERADDLDIAIPPTTEHLWPALKFQDFLRLSQEKRPLLHNFPLRKT